MYAGLLCCLVSLKTSHLLEHLLYLTGIRVYFPSKWVLDNLDITTKIYILRVLPTAVGGGRMQPPVEKPDHSRDLRPRPPLCVGMRKRVYTCAKSRHRSKRCRFSRGATLQPSRNQLLNVSAVSQKSPRQTMEWKMLKITTNCQLIMIQRVTAPSRAVQASDCFHNFYSMYPCVVYCDWAKQ